MNPSDVLPNFAKSDLDIPSASMEDLINLATQKQVFGVLQQIGLNEDQKSKLNQLPIGEILANLDYPQVANFRETLRAILSIDYLEDPKVKKKIRSTNNKINTINGEKSWTVTIDGVEHTRSVSQLFATTKDFTNYVNITGENSDYFKKGLQDIGADPDTKFILGEDIINSDTEANLILNGEIIRAIVKEQYNDNYFEFLKASRLVKLNGDKIDKSELTSYCSSDGYWRSDDLGECGYIWLRAVNEDGNPRYIVFGEKGASLCGDYPEAAMHVASQK